MAVAWAARGAARAERRRLERLPSCTRWGCRKLSTAGACCACAVDAEAGVAARRFGAQLAGGVEGAAGDVGAGPGAVDVARLAARRSCGACSRRRRRSCRAALVLGAQARPVPFLATQPPGWRVARAVEAGARAMRVPLQSVRQALLVSQTYARSSVRPAGLQCRCPSRSTCAWNVMPLHDMDRPHETDGARRWQALAPLQVPVLPQAGAPGTVRRAPPRRRPRSRRSRGCR